MDTTLTTVLISALFSILVAIITSWVSSTLYVRQTKADLQKEYASRFNERKWETYTRFATMVAKILEETKFKKLNTNKYIQELYGLTGELWIVGADKVIEAYVNWQDFSRQVINGQVKDENFQSLIKMAQILVEMRKDLGYTSDRATATDLLATFITDINKLST